MKMFDDETQVWYLRCDECPMVFLDVEESAEMAGWRITGSNRHLCEECAKALIQEEEE